MTMQYLKGILKATACALLISSPFSLYAAWSTPPEEISTGDGEVGDDSFYENPQIAAGTADNAVAVWVEYEGGGSSVWGAIHELGSWSEPERLSEITGSPGGDFSWQPEVAMDATNTAVAVWIDYDEINAQAAVWDGTSWSTVQVFDDGSGFRENPDVAMDGSGNAVIVWDASFNGPIRSAFYDGGTQTWSGIILVPTSVGAAGSELPAVDYSENGTAVVVSVTFFPGTNSDEIEASIYNGVTWSSPVIISTGDFNTTPDVGIDESGNATAVWRNVNTGQIDSAYWNGTTWTSTTTISTGGDNFNPRIAVAPNGNTVAVWEQDGTIVAREFDGVSWNTPTILSTGTGNETPQVSVDAFGNAVAVWSQETDGSFFIWSACLMFGFEWEGPNLVQSSETALTNPDVGVSTDFVAFTDWRIETADGFEVNAAVDENPCAPAPIPDINGEVCIDQFATQFDRVHIITWEPSTSASVVSYNILRNGELIGNVLATEPLIFRDHNRNRSVPDTYSVIAISQGNFESEPVIIVVQ
jgi:hypothetical protein